MKKVKLRLTIECEQDVHVDDDIDTIKFHFEENYCVSNIINDLYDQIVKDDLEHVCSICSVSEVKVLEVRDE